MSTVAANLTGETLRKARERAHLSQADAAKRLDVPLRTYKSWESRNPPTPWPRHRLALKDFLAELALEAAVGQRIAGARG